jgi:hypothetical protein
MLERLENFAVFWSARSKATQILDNVISSIAILEPSAV